MEIRVVADRTVTLRLTPKFAPLGLAILDLGDEKFSQPPLLSLKKMFEAAQADKIIGAGAFWSAVVEKADTLPPEIVKACQTLALSDEAAKIQFYCPDERLKIVEQALQTPELKQIVQSHEIH